MLTHENDKTVMCPIVGDGMVGKTQICKTFAGSQTSDDYTATVSDLYTVPTYMLGSNYVIKIVDSSGQHDYKEVRTKSYKEANVFILCYSVSDRDSFENVKSFWIPEIRNLCKKTPVVLVGTYKDTRDENNNVSKQEGLDIMESHKFDAFIECRSDNKEEVNELFEDILLSVIKSKRRRRSSLLRTLMGK
ncbi:Ras-like GTP-binding protein RhoL [Mytilus coruscus]|uniref:Ras-like GTP-binding protein RhoL n=1 Tax=Mytilus coruscus TaxID=42192 RepID=A0A6J7ZXG7_MYTCO|nr:Ras-like GTP-binding protein RhoL [Mytilus coruscus]